MPEYTYQDMLRMQAEAAERVREMKKRAIQALDEEAPVRSVPPVADEVRRISYPVDLSCLSEQNDTTSMKTANEKSRGFIDNLLHDRDSLIILALVFVLSRDSNDRIISLLLVYLLL